MMNSLLSAALITLFTAGVALAVAPVEVHYPGKIDVRNLEAGKPYLTNRKYLVKRVPPELSTLKFTVLPGGAYNDFEAKIPKGSVVYLAIDNDLKSPAASALHDYSAALDRAGWKYFGRLPVSDQHMEHLRILVKTFAEEETVVFKGIGFVGSMIIAAEILRR